MSRATVIEAIKKAVLENGEPLFKVVREQRVSEKDLADTELPGLIITSVKSEMSKQQWRTVIETFEIGFIIRLADTENPLSDLLNKEKSLITRLFDSKELNRIIISGGGDLGIVPKTSTASNSIVQYSQGGAISSTLTIEFKVATEY